MTVRKTLALLAILSLAAGCAPTLDPKSFQVMPEDKEKIAPLPKGVYVGTEWNIGVVEYANNTGIGPARVSMGNYEKSRSYVRGGAAGVVAAPGAVGIGYVEAGKSNTQGSYTNVQTEVIPMLGEAATSETENVLSSLGGVKLYSRQQLNKIFQEQQLQASGMINESTMVQLGKLAGLTHIITGSINSMTDGPALGHSPEGSTYTDKKGNVRRVAPSFEWKAEVNMTLQIISVETGQIVVSLPLKAIESNKIGGAQPKPQDVLNIAKRAIKEALVRSKVDLAKMFPMRGYIQQLRGGKQAVLINVGSKQQVASGDKFRVYDFEIIEDPVTNKKELSKSQVSEIVVAKDQVTENSAWALSDEKTRSRLKLGMLVEKVVEKGFMQGLKENTEFLK